MLRKTPLIVSLWLFLVLPLATAFIFRKSFDLGLYGDDWQHLYNLWRDFYVYKTKSFLDIRSYLNPYWPNYFYLGIINFLWGFYPPAYFIASYILRVFANIAIYFLTLELTKSRLAAFLTSLIFLFSATGLQTTDWVFNMNTYAGLGLLSLATIFYLRLRQANTVRSLNYLLFISTFALALAIVPTRMHGAIPFLILTDIFLLLPNFKVTRYLFARILTAVLIFTLLVNFKSFGEGSYTKERLSESYKVIQSYTQLGYNDIYFYFLGVLGHIVLPDTFSFNLLNGGLQKILPLKNPFTKTIISFSLISIFLSFFATVIIFKRNYLKVFLPALIFGISWALFLKFLVSLNANPSTTTLFSMALGGQFLFWAIWLYVISKKSFPLLAYGLVISVIWIICLTLIYWLFTPYFIIETTGRYMTMGGAGFAIFFAVLLTILFKSAFDFKKPLSEDLRLKSTFYFMFPFFLLLLWLIANFQTSQNYFNVMHQTRNRQLTDRSWGKLVKTVPKLDPTGPSIFYFTTDNPVSLYGVFEFGFFMRAGMTYRIPNQDLTPLPSTSYEELLSYVRDGTPLQKVHGRKAEPVPLSRIFAFDFRDGELVNITEAVRQKISQDLNLSQ